MKSTKPESPFENYEPNIGKKFNKYIILEPVIDQDYDYSKEIVLREAVRNLWGNIIAALAAIGFGLIPFFMDVQYEDAMSKTIFKVLSISFGIGGLFFLVGSIYKLLNPSDRSYAIISNKGIRSYNSETNNYIKLKWEDIKKAVLKLYSNTYNPDTYLLILTKQDHLIDIHLNYLVDPKSRLFDKVELKGLIGHMNPKHDDIRKFLGQYLESGD